MRKLSTWLEIPFMAAAISIQEMAAFATDHIQRLIALNLPGLAARLAATVTANQTFEQCFSTDLAQGGARKASKITKDAFRKAIPAKMNYFEGAIKFKFGSNAAGATAAIAQAFPQGRSVFSTCADDTCENHIDTLIAGLTAHMATVGAPLVTEATDYKAAWVAVYDASEAATGTKTTTKEAKNAAKAALAKELFLNLLAIAALHPGEPEKLAIYMQQSLLEDHPQAGDEDQPPVPPPGP